MFSSPAPSRTARRSTVRPRESISSRASPSFSQTTRRTTSVAGTPVPSRFATSLRPVTPESDDAMDMEAEKPVERDGVVLVRDECHVVQNAGSLPNEVQQLLREGDLHLAPYAAGLDQSTGFAFVINSDVCILWNYAKRSQSSPTTYVFPVPAASAARLTATTPPLALAALVKTSYREPGLLLISPTGEARYWEAVSTALSGADRYKSQQIDLEADELAAKLYSPEPGTFLLSTTHSRVIRLQLSTSSGQFSFQVQPFTRPMGVFSRASSAIFMGDNEGITTIAFQKGPRGDGCDAWVLAGRMLQRWKVLDRAGQKFVWDCPLKEIIAGEIFDDVDGAVAHSLDILDLITLHTGELAFLIAYQDESNGFGSTSRTQRTHAVVVVEVNERAAAALITRVVYMTYKAHIDPRPLALPRLAAPHGGTVAFVHFADVIVVLSLSRSGTYEEVVALRDHSQNAFLAIGYDSSSSNETLLASVTTLTIQSGLLNVDVNLRALPASAMIPQQDSATARLISKLEQAIFFDDIPGNPLSFAVKASFDGDFAVATEKVSADVLASSSTYMPNIYELRSQLLDRTRRLQKLIAFVKENGLLDALSQSARMVLSGHAEKLQAAVDLWNYQNPRMDHLNSRTSKSLLADAITVCMNNVGYGIGEDVIRKFFRTHVAVIDQVLEHTYKIAKSSRDATDSVDERSTWLLEANTILLTAYRTSWQFIQDNINLYMLDREQPPFEPWKSRTALLEALEYLYFNTEKLIHARTRAFGSNVDEAPLDGQMSTLAESQRVQTMLKSQLCDLAAVLCSAVEDRLRFIATKAAQDGSDARDEDALLQRYQSLKPAVIRPLVKIDQAAKAFELAEHYSDFETLVLLCNDPTTGSGIARIQSYIEQYEEKFAYPLYEWYIAQGRTQDLLSQDEVYGWLLTNFFDSHDYPRLAWIHDLQIGRYAHAASSLSLVGAVEEDLSQKHLMASISKLAAVVHMKSSDEAPAVTNRALDEIDDELDLIRTETRLRDEVIEFGKTLSRQSRSMPALAEAYVSEKAALLDERPSFRSILVKLYTKLLDGKALGFEELVDVLTLKDNAGDSQGDAAKALELFVRSTLPEGRKQVALLSIWRRVYIRDNWAEIANTTGRSDQQLRELLGSTALHDTLKALYKATRHPIPQPFILAPDHSLALPTTAEIAARFPDARADEVQGLLTDHEYERELLDGYIRGADLRGWTGEVTRLVQE